MGYKDIPKPSSAATTGPRKKIPALWVWKMTRILPFPNLWVLEATHYIVIPRVTLVERYHGDGPASLLVPAATQQVPDYANPCVRGLTTRVACRYCKRVRSTSAAAETQIVGSDLRTFQRRHWKVLSAVAAYVT